MKLSDFVISFIAKQNVKDIFLLPGGGNMHLIDAVELDGQRCRSRRLHQNLVGRVSVA